MPEIPFQNCLAVVQAEEPGSIVKKCGDTWLQALKLDRVIG
jgi:hypothetical protein